MTGIAAAPAAAQQAPGPNADKPVRAILELFTSQGCSSCPPADLLLQKLAKRPDIIALSLPVDYWDYLGWKDTLASPKFTARQKAYAKVRGDGRVYTPQMIVSGRTHAIGSSESSIEEAIKATEAAFQASRVPVSLHIAGKKLVIETGDGPDGAAAKEATIWLAMVHRHADIKIERGENHGKTVGYTNVVKELSPIGMWSGKRSVLEISRDAVANAGNEACVVLLQAGMGGPIIGAAMMNAL